MVLDKQDAGTGACCGESGGEVGRSCPNDQYVVWSVQLMDCHGPSTEVADDLQRWRRPLAHGLCRPTGAELVEVSHGAPVGCRHPARAKELDSGP